MALRESVKILDFTVNKKDGLWKNLQKSMEVQTSADGTEWKSMGTSEMPYLSLDEYVVSTPFYMPEGTSRIRVYCVGRSNTVNVINDCGVGTFHMAEFQMYRVNDNFGKEFDLNSILLKYDEYIGGELSRGDLHLR